MKGRIYAITLIIAFFVGTIGLFFAASYSLWDTIFAVAGFLASLLVAPTVHEFGHMAFAWGNRFKVVYTKFFFFRFYYASGRIRFAFASPFGGDETRTLPTSGEDMKKRALAVVGGGLIFSGIFALLLVVPAVVLLCLKLPVFFLWGMIPYALYLFLLNVLPAQYANGKTDALIYAEIKKDCTEGKAFLSAMEVQGRLYAGESFSEIPETLYETYGLCEDEPLFAVLWDLKYHYYLDKNDLEKAADALNRLIVSAPYLTSEAVDSVRIESAYMLLLQKDSSQLKSLLETDEKLLRSDDYRIKRLLATYAYACGDKKKGKALAGQAKAALEKERIVGIRKHELTLLSRLSV